MHSIQYLFLMLLLMFFANCNDHYKHSLGNYSNPKYQQQPPRDNSNDNYLDRLEIPPNNYRILNGVSIIRVKSPTHITIAGKKFSVAPHLCITHNGKKISPVFHEFAQLSDGSVVGKMGSLRFLLKKAGGIYVVASHGYHDIMPLETGYMVMMGAWRGRMNKDGNCENEPQWLDNKY